jgi:DNA-binding MarR family transcriptional regulator
MSESQAPPLPLGTTIAFAQRELTALLHGFLAEQGAQPGTWYALKALSIRGPELPADAFRHELAQAPAVGPDAAGAVIDGLVAEGLIAVRADGTVAATAEGEAAFERLRESVDALTVEIQSPVDRADLETTIRTLGAVTKRAEALQGKA